MTRFVVDAGVVLCLLRDDERPSADHQLLAPTLIGSEILSTLYSAVQRGEIPEESGRDQLERFSKVELRLLGDAVLRRVAWKVASQLGYDSTYRAEYVALTKLQADALVTLDEELASQASAVVETAPFDALFQ